MNAKTRLLCRNQPPAHRSHNRAILLVLWRDPPADWGLLAAAEAWSNPGLRDAVGNLALVPLVRRIHGPGASLVMGAFTHASRRRPGRFSKGGYGVWYCGDRLEVAHAETAHHFEPCTRATREHASGWRGRD